MQRAAQQASGAAGGNICIAQQPKVLSDRLSDADNAAAVRHCGHDIRGRGSASVIKTAERVKANNVQLKLLVLTKPGGQLGGCWHWKAADRGHKGWQPARLWLCERQIVQAVSPHHLYSVQSSPAGESRGLCHAFSDGNSGCSDNQLLLIQGQGGNRVRACYS